MYLSSFSNGSSLGFCFFSVKIVLVSSTNFPHCFLGLAAVGVGEAGSVGKNVRPTDCMGCFLDSVLECRVAETRNFYSSLV